MFLLLSIPTSLNLRICSIIGNSEKLSFQFKFDALLRPWIRAVRIPPNIRMDTATALWNTKFAWNEHQITLIHRNLKLVQKIADGLEPFPENRIGFCQFLILFDKFCNRADIIRNHFEASFSRSSSSKLYCPVCLLKAGKKQYLRKLMQW